MEIEIRYYIWPYLNIKELINFSLVNHFWNDAFKRTKIYNLISYLSQIYKISRKKFKKLEIKDFVLPDINFYQKNDAVYVSKKFITHFNIRPYNKQAKLVYELLVKNNSLTWECIKDSFHCQRPSLGICVIGYILYREENFKIASIIPFDSWINFYINNMYFCYNEIRWRNAINNVLTRLGIIYEKNTKYNYFVISHIAIHNNFKIVNMLNSFILIPDNDFCQNCKNKFRRIFAHDPNSLSLLLLK